MIPGRHYFIFMLLISLSACGGGETGTGAAPGGDISVGAITGFGSVWVNGVRFDSTGTAISLEGTSVSQSELREGMVVRVRGSINADGVSGVANQIVAEAELRGPVQLVNDASSLLVLGQVVQAGPLVVLEGMTAVTELMPGDLVEINGFVKQDGIISATRIAVDNSISEYKLTGYLTSLDPATMTFKIGQQNISYAGADLTGMNGQPLEAVTFVRVSGSLDANLLVATTVRTGDVEDHNAGHIELEGYVTSFASESSFVVNGVPVRTSILTDFQGGLPADVSVGVKLEVEGSLIDGALYADMVEFHESIRLESMLQSVDAAAGTLVLNGLETLIIRVDGNTDLRGTTGLAQLSPVHTIRLRGILAGDNSIVATRLEARVETSTMVALQGPLDADPVYPGFSVLGIDVNTSTWQDSDCSLDNAVSSCSLFYTTARAGDLVDVEGDYQLGSVTWTKLELD